MARRSGRQRLIVFPIQLNGFLNNQTKFMEHIFLVITISPAHEQRGTVSGKRGDDYAKKF